MINRTKFTIILILLSLILLKSGSVSALDHLIISQVLYNPNGSDTDREAIEIYNPTNETINLNGWHLATSSSSSDLTLPNSSIKPHSYFLVADSGWSTHKNSDWPDADYEESISLVNTNGGVALINKDNNSVDSVGWGDENKISPTLYEGTPSTGVADGEALLRRKDNSSFIDTDNNSNDFYAGEVNLHNSNYTSNNKEGINIYFRVVQPDLEVLNITILDDINETNNSITPKPNSYRKLYVKVEVNLNSSVNISLTNLSYVNQANLTKAGNFSYEYMAEFEVPYYSQPGIYNVKVEVRSGNQSVTNYSSFKYESLLSITIDANSIDLGDVKAGSDSIIFGDSDTATLDSPTVKNTGNVVLDAKVLPGTYNGFEYSNIYYSFGSAQVTNSLSDERNFDLNLEPADSTAFNIKLEVPKTQALGRYSCLIMIQGVGSE